jgi:hypothetical protein
MVHKRNNNKKMQALKYTSAIAILWRLREENIEFKALLSHIVRCCPSSE